MTRVLFNFIFYFIQFLLLTAFRRSSLQLTQHVGTSKTRICVGRDEGFLSSMLTAWRTFFRDKFARKDINPLDGRVNYLDHKALYAGNADAIPKAIFINPKSGGRIGNSLFSKLASSLDEDQICNLSTERPSDKLKYLAEHNSSFAPNSPKVALCCGGDGTVRWIMDEAKKANYSSTVKFGLIPLGTGNDLFNHVVSSQYNTTDAKEVRAMLSPSNLIADTRIALTSFDSSSCISNLDRWKMVFHNQPVRRVSETYKSDESRDQYRTRVKRRKFRKFVLATLKKVSDSDLVKASRRFSELRSKKKREEKLFNNYYGIGIDGAITAMYDNLRRDRPYLFFHKIANKFWYGMSWLYKLLRGGNISLSECMTLYCDKARVPLPPGIRGLIVINIDSYASGTKLWQVDGLGWRKQRSDDGVIEVVGIYGLAHLAQVKAGLRQPLLITQGHNLRIVTNKTLPMQVDGEPWTQSAMEVDISLSETVQILVPALPSSLQ
jgi:diacylglycerol kinase family enzyme